MSTSALEREEQGLRLWQVIPHGRVGKPETGVVLDETMSQPGGQQ
jgi:hypothetical protein